MQWLPPPGLIIGAGLACLMLMTDAAEAQCPSGVKDVYGQNSRRVRSTSARLAHLIRDGAGRSVTLQGLTDRIERTDWLVYVEFGTCPDQLRGCLLHWVGGGGTHRYLRILVRPGLDDDQLVAIVGHELQHAIEAIELDVKTSADLSRRLYWFEQPTNRVSRWRETAAGQRAGDAVRSEVRNSRRRGSAEGRTRASDGGSCIPE